MSRRAVVVGAGPNGLAAAVVAAQAGFAVEVFEAEAQAGGAARTMELTLPGFRHDFGSAVHPMAAGSPFFNSLRLPKYGLEWVHFPAPLAHPLNDGTAVVLERDLVDAESALGRDGKSWRRIFEPFAERWEEFSCDILQPLFRVPRHPFLLAKFGTHAMLPAKTFANLHFHEARTKALFAGLAAHSFLALEEPMSAAVAMVLGATAHAVGWPVPRGGARSITDALAKCLEGFGGEIRTSQRVERLDALGEYDIALCDVAPQNLLKMADFTPAYARILERYRPGPGVFKVDYALSSPIPWKAADCARASTVHVGGTMEEIATSEREVREGQHPERPFVLLAQPTLCDKTRAPEGKHVAWAYCHVPNGSQRDMLPEMEVQIERFAPGFRDCVLARRVWTTSDLESRDANLVGGDINNGLPDWKQFFLRPSWRMYGTSLPRVYLCSAATPPGGGVHGMCGANAGKVAVKRWGE